MEPEKPPKKKKSDRETETLFRVTYRNQNNLIQIADNKANIVISINAMIISSIIAITGYGAIANQLDLYKSNIIVPIALIVISCLVSAMFAIQAARPKVISASKVQDKEEKSSLLFFGVIARHSQKEYLEKMNELLQSRTDIHENMTIDIYNQGLILTRKYRLLSYAYQVFMFGFTISVLIFLIFIML